MTGYLELGPAPWGEETDQSKTDCERFIVQLGIGEPFEWMKGFWEVRVRYSSEAELERALEIDRHLPEKWNHV